MKHIFTISLCFLALSLSAQEDCPNTYDGNADGAVTINDLLDLLAVFGDTDTDSDGIWDSIDDCIDLTACNYANDPTEACNYIDVLGICGGGCEGDSDNDGICDSDDDCIGVVDECGVCNGPGATEMIIESITILYDSVYAEAIDNWFVFEVGADTVFNYVCDPVFAACGDLVSHEGYDYSTVLIGDQCWFAENCRYLPIVSDPSIDSTTEPHYSVYGYTGTDVTAAMATGSYSIYGVLYNWPAVMTEGICPSGWHIPTDGEFTELTDFLGGESVAGYSMKSTSGWIDYNGSSGNGSNSSGFNCLPGGFRDSGGFGNGGGVGHWWSASEPGSYSWSRQLSYGNGNVNRASFNRYYGFSARCVIDYTDECGVLNGDNSTCLDECGVPNGDSSTCADCGDLVAHEGYDYSTVWIGEQCWFSENCRYLPSVTANEDSYDVPMYYVYDYEGTDVAAAQATSNYETYGVLYNWPAVMTEGICPSGWHIPSDLEFTQLANFLGGENIAGEQMKSTSGWDDGGNGSNTSGWTGLPGGGFVPGFNFDGYIGSWWSSSASDSSLAWIRKLQVEYVDVIRYSNSRNGGYSARCVRD